MPERLAIGLANLFLGRLWVIGLVLLCLGPATTRLFAHATLIRTQPVSGAILTQSPRQVRLEFSEPIEAEFNGIAVYNSKGTRMDSLHASPDLSDVRAIQLPLDELSSGAYTVVWHVISADGHPIEGAFGFMIGTAMPGAQLTIPRPLPWKQFLVPLAGAVHAMAILGMLLLAGLPLFYWLVFRPAANSLPGFEVQEALSEATIQPVVVRVLRFALLLAIAASVVSLLVEAVRVVGDVTAAVSLSLLFRLASRTRFGQMWSLRVAGLLVVLGLTWWLIRSRGRGLSGGRSRLVSFLSILLLLTPGLGGHPAAAPGRTALFLVTADWLHLLAAAPWVAGLWTFVFVLRRLSRMDRHNQDRFTVALVDRFPRVAVGSVALLVISGAFAALEHIPSWKGLFHTSYGQAILSKSVLLLPVLALAAAHHFLFRHRALPLIGTGNDRQISHVVAGFRKMVCLELALVGAIMVAAGLLVNLPPAEASLAAAAGNFFNESRETTGVRLTLRIRPTRVGLNSAEIEFSARDKDIDIDQLQPTLTARMLTHDMGLQEIALKRVSKDRFRAEDLMLSMSGPWELGVMAALQDGREIQASFRLYVPPAE